jgi:lipopolysaccharide biosynthesis protein
MVAVQAISPRDPHPTLRPQVQRDAMKVGLSLAIGQTLAAILFEGRAMSIKSRIRSSLRRIYRTVNPVVRGEPRPEDGTNLIAAVPFNYDLSEVQPPGAIGVICHIFYDDLGSEMRRLVENIPFPVDVFISTDTEAKRIAIDTAFAGWSKGRYDIRIAQNRGRDIAPKLVSFRDVYEDHELILFLHSKKSLASSIGEIGAAWRQTMTRSLVGSSNTVRSIMDVFSQHPDIGIVMCEHFEPIREFLNWDGNFRIAKQLAKRMGFRLTPRHILELPSGSMFWFRSRALRPLLDLNLTFRNFPREKGQIRETTHHAIERLMLYICEHAGFKWIKVADPSVFEDNSRIVRINSRRELGKFVVEARLNLLNQVLDPVA